MDSTNGVFHAQEDGHQELDGDSLLFAGQLVDAGHLAQELLVNGTRTSVVGKSHKNAHVEGKDAILRDKIDALAGTIESGQDFVEVFQSRLGRTHANHTR